MPCALDASIAIERVGCWGTVVQTLARVGAMTSFFVNAKGIVLICRNSSKTCIFQIALNSNFFKSYQFSSNAQGWKTETPQYSIFDIPSKKLALVLKRGISSSTLAQFDIHVVDLGSNPHLTFCLKSNKGSIRKFTIPFSDPEDWNILPSGYPSIAIQVSQANTWFETAVATLKSYMDYMEPQAQVLELQFRYNELDHNNPTSLILALEAYTESVLGTDSSWIRLPIFTQARVSDTRLLQTNVDHETVIKIRHREFRSLILLAIALDYTCNLRGEIGYEGEAISSPTSGPTYSLFSLDGESMPAGIQVQAGFKSEGGISTNLATPSFSMTASGASTIIESRVAETVIDPSSTAPVRNVAYPGPIQRTDSEVTWNHESGNVTERHMEGAPPHKRRLVAPAVYRGSHSHLKDPVRGSHVPMEPPQQPHRQVGPPVNDDDDDDDDDDLLLSAFPTQVGPTQTNSAKGLFD